MQIRLEIEQRELNTLSPLASLASRSKGRAIEEPPDPIRTNYMLRIGTGWFIPNPFAA